MAEHLFHRAHYNIIAKQIRELYPLRYNGEPDDTVSRVAFMEERRTLERLALRLAKRFKKDNPYFDPLAFLDACSPDTDLYPLSELWEDDDA